MKVSYFNSMRSKVEEQMEFSEYIQLVKKGLSKEYIGEIKQLRKLFTTNESKYKLKKEKLPIITPHAIIKGKREDANVVEHSGIVSADVDIHNNDPKKIAKFNDPLALAWHRSISNEGFVVYYKFDIKKRDHRSAFETISRRLKDKFGINADPHVKALSVPRFISYDPNAVFNKNAKVMEIKTFEQSDSEMPKANRSDQEQLRELTSTILKKKANIVDDRESWVKMAAVYCRAFAGDAEGLDLFVSISRISKKFKGRGDCAKVYKSFIGKQTDKPATIGSLIYLMEESGIKVETEEAKLAHFDEREEEDEDDEDLLLELFLTKEPPKDIPVIQWTSQYRDEKIDVCTKKNYSTMVGKMKSGKTFALVFMIISASIKERIKKIRGIKFNFNILVFDTEQGKPHVWKAMNRVLSIMGWMPATVSLRAKSYKERIKIIRQAVKQYEPELIIIDGIRDLMADFNAVEETMALITYLEKLTDYYDNHIINILHLNKTDENARGHIGTELLNRSETIIRVDAIKLNDGIVHKISCEYSRNEPFKEFGLQRKVDVRHGIDFPEICDVPTKDKQRIDLPVDELRKRLSDNIFGQKYEVKGGEFVKMISKEFKVGNSKARMYQNQFIKDGVIKFVGNNKNDPNGKYKILID